jgi:hypothetical protein
MIHYATYDENGKYIGFYNHEIHGNNIPTPNIELNQDEWQEAMTGCYSVVNGLHTKTITYSPEDLAMSSLRSERNNLLKNSDWTQFPDSPLSSEKKSEWSLYRQALRDFPSVVDLSNVVFPTEPV